MTGKDLINFIKEAKLENFCIENNNSGLSEVEFSLYNIEEDGEYIIYNISADKSEFKIEHLVNGEFIEISIEESLKIRKCDSFEDSLYSEITGTSLIEFILKAKLEDVEVKVGFDGEEFSWEVEPSKDSEIIYLIDVYDESFRILYSIGDENFSEITIEESLKIRNLVR